VPEWIGCRLLLLAFLTIPFSPQAAAQSESTLPGVGATAEPATPTGGAPVVVFNRKVVEFRVPYYGSSAEERAERTEARLRDLLSRGGPAVVTTQEIEQGHLILLDGSPAVIITNGDADALAQETPAAAAQRAASALRQLVADTREARDFDSLLKALIRVGIATAILAAAWWVLRRLRSLLAARLLKVAHRQSEKLKVGGAALVQRDRLLDFVRSLLLGVFLLLVLLLVYEWLGYVLAQFPYTRPWGQRLSQFLIDLVAGFGGAIISALPSLVVAAAIFLIAHFMNRGVKGFFHRVETGQIQLSWLEADLAPPTRRLASVVLWIFALAMAYPYLPGSGTDAFKGLSLLIGLMVSIGSSSLVAQAGSGLILMYTRTLKEGEYVAIGESEGTVVALGMFSTRVRTGLGEELTLPNSLVLQNVTKNYSRTVRGQGFVLDTTVTIGYDTPWRQVEAMLIEAARRTPGVVDQPAPHVFQRALSDFYPEYRLVCQAVPSQPRPRAEVLSALHGNIQDVFNEHQVQIMSPHYLGDPGQAKVVPKEHWYAPPARKPPE
jgi:small-conductance mechanosensitive channel